MTLSAQLKKIKTGALVLFGEDDTFTATGAQQLLDGIEGSKKMVSVRVVEWLSVLLFAFVEAEVKPLDQSAADWFNADWSSNGLISAASASPEVEVI